MVALFMSVAMDANRHHMPLVESEWAKRAVTAAMGLMFILLGVGAVRLRPWVLYSLPIIFTV